MNGMACDRNRLWVEENIYLLIFLKYAHVYTMTLMAYNDPNTAANKENQ